MVYLKIFSFYQILFSVRIPNNNNVKLYKDCTSVFLFFPGPTSHSTTRDSTSSPDVTTLDDDMSDEQSLSPEEIDESQSEGKSPHDRNSEGGKAGRRRRTAFTSEQLLELEKEFHAKKYLSLTERSQIAHALKLSEVKIKGSLKKLIWILQKIHKNRLNSVHIIISQTISLE